MARNENKWVMITDTILRDAHQSQAATRMRTDEMVPVLEQLDEIGYYSLEAWGGATFDTCLRFLNLKIKSSHKSGGAAKTFWVTAIIRTMWCGRLSGNRSRTA